MRDFIQLPVILCSYGFFLSFVPARFSFIFFGKLLKEFLIQLSFEKSSFDQTKKKTQKPQKSQKTKKPTSLLF